MGQFTFTDAPLAGMFSVEPAVHGDARGYFMETYSAQDFAAAGHALTFVQDNQSSSSRGVLRGLHFQKKNPQGKLVRVISGEVFDVGVDIRPGSVTFGRWFGMILSADNKKQLFVPEGFAHGFLVLSDTAEFQYKCTRFYDPTDEGGLRWNDPDIGVQWPHMRGAADTAAGEMEIVLSEKDKVQPTWEEFVKGNM
ncbi:MAG: dTDP-4-dehydrorhamnose 3,5-epimerase [Oscillospiraceae bacterium]|nr:dTDP-4-dehydrorhamnose 3,5-epimerase [Oscillospiraceae bacterium]